MIYEMKAEVTMDNSKGYKEISRQLLDYIDASPSCYHAIANIIGELKGYTELKEDEKWQLKPGGRYYVVRNSSSVIAFRIPSGFRGFRSTAAHSDSPAFKLKPDCEIGVEKHYIRLNTEKYGGMLMAPWFDRPLSVAGRIFTEDGNDIREQLVNIDRDLLIIPNVAIHMNRDANKGLKYNEQQDLLPLLAGSVPEEGRDNPLMNLIAEEAGVEPGSILGSDLFLYPRTKGTVLGLDGEMIASRALDDLQCAWGIMQGFVASDNGEDAGDKADMCCIFDNEEVGSLTNNGADSTFLYDTLIRICGEDSALRRMLANSFMISADNAHAVHPNHPEYTDPTNRPYINGGVVLKFNANRKYTTDGYSEAVIRSLCRRAEVPLQTYVNRSDIAGGSTLGNISGRHVSIPSADIGLPQLAMHSCYETAGAYDTKYLIDLIKEFYRFS